jgi:hypothetical protein
VAKQTFRTLLRDAIEAVKASSVPIKSVEYDPGSKRLRVEFDREPAPAPLQTLPIPPGSGSLSERIQAAEVKYLPGTRIPDDNSPVDPLEIVQANVRYELPIEGNGV